MFSSHFPYLHFVWVYIYSVPHIPIKPNCCNFVRVVGLVGPFGVYVSCVLVFYWEEVFYIFDLLEGGCYLRGILQRQYLFFIFKKIALLTNVIFQFNFNITKVFSVAKQNLFYSFCHITFEIVPF